EDIEIPAYIVASWSDHGLHSRGTLDFFRQISSEHKWLEVHGQKKWSYFYHPDSVERQRIFFDTFLKGEERGIESWPRVQVEVRDTTHPADSTWRELPAWPLPERARALHLDVEAGQLLDVAPTSAASTTFDPITGSLDLTYTFTEDSE